MTVLTEWDAVSVIRRANKDIEHLVRLFTKATIAEQYVLKASLDYHHAREEWGRTALRAYLRNIRDGARLKEDGAVIAAFHCVEAMWNRSLDRAAKLATIRGKSGNLAKTDSVP